MTDPRRQRVFGWVFLAGISIFFAFLNLSSGSGSGGEETEAAGGAQFLWLGLYALFYVPAYWVFPFSTRRFAWSLSEWGFGFSRRAWMAIGLSVLMVLVVLLKTLSPAGSGEAATGTGWQGDMAGRIGWPVLLFICYARVAEELIYRGFALVFLRRFPPWGRYPALTAILVSSLLFSLVHTHHSPGGIVNLFLFGAVPLAAITVWTRSLSFALVVHGIAGAGYVGGLFGLAFFLVVALAGRRVGRSAGDTARTPTSSPP